jgi:hypothetical protein
MVPDDPIRVFRWVQETIAIAMILKKDRNDLNLDEVMQKVEEEYKNIVKQAFCRLDSKRKILEEEKERFIQLTFQRANELMQ